jgi:hypothetical protein
MFNLKQPRRAGPAVFLRQAVGANLFAPTKVSFIIRGGIVTMTVSLEQ